MLLTSHIPLGLGHGGILASRGGACAAPASVCRPNVSISPSTGLCGSSSSLCALKHGKCAHALPFVRPQQLIHGSKLRTHSSSPNSDPSPADQQQQQASGVNASPSARSEGVPSSQQAQGAELEHSSSSSNDGGGPASDGGGTPRAKQDVPEEEASARVDSEGAPSPQQQQQQQQQQQLAAMSPWKELAAAMAALAAFFRSASHGILALLNRVPMWVQQQHLKKLREASDEDPKNTDKHAALLSELNKVNPREVISRVESKEYAAGAAVVAEYLRALVNTGKLAEYTASQGTPERGQDHRSMAQLLKEMQAQLAAEEQDNMPGSSLRRPLHVTVQGGQLMQMNKPTGPLQAIWALLTTAMLIVGMAFLWLVGSQAMRRMQAASPSTSAAVGGMPSSSSSGSPSLEPKEFKKEELPEKSIKSFKDVRGCDEAKEELQEVVEFLKNPAKFTRLGAKLPKGVLLTGPPGTGKTLLARAVAGEAGVPFFYRAGSEFEELYVGVGSRRMRALFQAAKKKSPCIVFIDEIDAIGGNRKHWENHARKTLNQLLVEMDGFESNEGVIVMAATNLAETLDPALKRPGRFDRQVAVPLPDIKGRTELIEYYLHDKPFAADVDRDVLARQTQGFSGADISNLVNEAALTAAKEGADIIAPHMLDQAFDKIRMGVERKSVRRTEQARKRTAYHEAGHAIVALHTPGASPIHKATIVPRGHALGMVSQVGREDEFSINRQQMLARIWVCMGGQVAEELMFGRDQVTTGATDDLRQATDMARFMVSECGMNDVVGPMYVSEGDARHNVLSETVKERIDAQVRSLLVEARTGVMQLLQSRVADLHSLAGALIEVETLTSKQINELLGIGTAEVPSTPSSSSGSGGSGGDRQKDPMDPAGVLAPGTPVPTAQNAAPSLSPSPPTTQHQHHQHQHQHQQPQHHQHPQSAQQQQGPPFAVMGVQTQLDHPSPASLQGAHEAAQAVLASSSASAEAQQGSPASVSQQQPAVQGTLLSSVSSADTHTAHSPAVSHPSSQQQQQPQQQRQRQQRQNEDALMSRLTSHLPLRYEHAQAGGEGSEVSA